MDLKTKNTHIYIKRWTSVKLQGVRGLFSATKSLKYIQLHCAHELKTWFPRNQHENTTSPIRPLKLCSYVLGTTKEHFDRFDMKGNSCDKLTVKWSPINFIHEAKSFSNFLFCSFPPGLVLLWIMLIWIMNISFKLFRFTKLWLFSVTDNYLKQIN